ncbi:MAG: RNA polymerase sigma factor SigJ [Pseudomonadales bacterium]|nr:RNA polymerase sigma factor SigJ [Pseudomonadales bacterium]
MSLSRLESLAYRMLGSIADAEDVVQEAQVRLLQLKQSEEAAAVENEQAWLFRVVTNLSLDRLRALRRAREQYPGPWLPEPVMTDQEAPEALTGLAEELSLGLLFVLERLSPLERVVFILREGFDLPFDDIAVMVDASAASCRQRYRRAREHLRDEPRFPAPAAAQGELLNRLLLAVAEKDSAAIVALFDADAVVYTDGGGVVSAAVRPVTDPRRIAQVLLHLAQKGIEEGGIDYTQTLLNGAPALLLSQNGVLHSTVQLEVRDNRILRLYVMRNPDKLTRVRLTPACTGRLGTRINVSVG